MKLPDIRSIDSKNKRVFLRLDLDVYLENGQILDDARLWATWDTAQFLVEQGSQVIIAGHLGRPKGADKQGTLIPIAQWYERRLNLTLSEAKIGEFKGWKFGEQVSILENLRFYPGEEENNEDFAKKLSQLADIYVNDAFGASHRNHASITGVPKLLPHYAGLRLQKEVEELSKVLENPARPLVVVIGGEKIETKLPLVEKMLRIGDHVLVGGEIATELPANDSHNPKVLIGSLNSGKTDLNDEDIEKFKSVIKTAKTIVWNGPMGVIQKEETQKGTIEIANAITSSPAHTIVGGGNTVGFLKQKGLLEKFSFVSTGGGAMLEFLSGEKLPGLEALL
jgi:phosphoglycerate kinase